MAQTKNKELDFPKLLRKLRTRLNEKYSGDTQRLLAAKMGGGLTTLKGWENGTQAIREFNLRKLITALYQLGAFIHEKEIQEAQELWEAAEIFYEQKHWNRNNVSYASFDKSWFEKLTTSAGNDEKIAPLADNNNEETTEEINVLNLPVATHNAKVQSNLFSYFLQHKWKILSATAGFLFLLYIYVQFENNYNNTQSVELVTAHPGRIMSLDWATDGGYIASGSSDGKVRVWDSTTGKLLKPAFSGHTQGVINIQWSNTATRIASASDDKTIRIWDSSTGEVLTKLIGHTDYVFSVAWSPDNTKLASASYDKTVKLWDVSNNQESVIRTLQDHTSSVNTVDWSPDGTKIASGADDEAVILWDSQGNYLNTLNGHTSNVQQVSWSPDSSLLASSSRDKSIIIWKVNTGEKKILTGHKDTVWRVAWSPDGKKLASASDDKTVRIWDNHGELLNILKHPAGLRGLAWSPDSKTLATGCDDNKIRLWQLT